MARKRVLVLLVAALAIAGASVAVTSARPEWDDDSGIDPQHAASARTMPKASGNVLGTTTTRDRPIRSETWSCSSLPVKWTRRIASRDTAR